MPSDTFAKLIKLPADLILLNAEFLSYLLLSSTMLKLLGLFNPLMKEMVEMHYLFETTVILDDSKLRAKLGEVKKTPYEEGIKQTLKWMGA